MLNLEEKILELESVIDLQNTLIDSFADELCKIIFEGEDTEIGRKITIDRIKTLVGYNGWLEKDD